MTFINENAGNLERMLTHLEATNLSHTTQESIEKRVMSIFELLEMHQLPPENPLYQRLDEFSEKALNYYQTQEELRRQKQESRKEICYVGVSGKNKVRVVASSNCFEMVRVYHDRCDYFRDKSGKDVPKRITLSWLFNPKGRIEKVHYSLFPEDTNKILMKIEKRFPPVAQWESGLFYHDYLPDRMKVVCPEIFSHAKIKRYLAILRFGHSAVKSLAEDVIGEDIKDSYVLMDRQVQLREITRNPRAINMINNANQSWIEIQGMINGMYNVVYTDIESETAHQE